MMAVDFFRNYTNGSNTLSEHTLPKHRINDNIRTATTLSVILTESIITLLNWQLEGTPSY